MQYPNFASLMRNRDVFGDDADAFRPERWLHDGPHIARMAKTVDLAFGYGRSMCLGKPMAIIELNKFFVEVGNVLVSVVMSLYLPNRDTISF